MTRKQLESPETLAAAQKAFDIAAKKLPEYAALQRARRAYFERQAAAQAAEFAQADRFAAYADQVREDKAKARKKSGDFTAPGDED